MTIDDEAIGHLEELSRMEVGADLREAIRAQLGEILGYVRQLEELDTDGIEPTTHVHTTHVMIRDDEVGPCLEREEALRAAPARCEGQFLVPRVIEEEGAP